MSEIVKKKISNEVAKFDNFSNVGEMLDFAKVLIDSKLVPDNLSKPEQVVAIITQGKELGFSAMTALNNMHNIQGKATLGIHAIAALIRQSGIKYELTEDYVWIREDGTGDKYKKKDIKYVDIRTTITFYEKWQDKTLTTPFIFTWNEATKMELTKKSNWKKMPSVMLRNRCLALGARFVAPEAILGVYEAAEWADAKGSDILLDAEGNVI